MPSKGGGVSTGVSTISKIARIGRKRLKPKSRYAAVRIEKTHEVYGLHGSSFSGS
jgi:hypothetical protein